MVKEIERAGLPVVHVCTIVPISLTVGANRIVPAVAIPYPLGDPNRTPRGGEGNWTQLEKARKALQTEVTEQTVFTD
ncbi:hypothetical protein MASR2M17_15520 [Aminivibrio sp.]